MKSLGQLIERQLRTSMLHLVLGISIATTVLQFIFQFQQLKTDLKLTKNFVNETTKNALALQQTIMLQRSIDEFWEAFAKKTTAIEGFELYFDDTLIGQVGHYKKKEFVQLTSKSCYNINTQKICINYFINSLRFFSDFFYILGSIFSVSFLVFFRRRYVAHKEIAILVKPLSDEIASLSQLSKQFEKLDRAEFPKTNSEVNALPIKELFQLSEAYRSLIVHSQRFSELDKANEISRSLGSLAAQVAHDIRSPLAALNMLIGTLKNIPEDPRIALRAATNRINDIANHLLMKSKIQNPCKAAAPSSKQAYSESETKKLTPELLSALSDTLVSEKRLQFRCKLNIKIELDLEDSYGAFALIDAMETKRVISNLINNSVEAINDNEGRIVVTVKNYKSGPTITVRDNGAGIPEHILEKLGQHGVTFGKEGTLSGSGLGLYHAKKTIESFNAKLTIESRLGTGTEVIMKFPKCKTPDWFVSELKISSDLNIFALDDESSVLEIWKRRFGVFKENDVRLFTFSTPEDFRKHLAKNTEAVKSSIFLVDYEFLNSQSNGLDLIEQLGIENRSFLVTSRYDEPNILSRCESLGVRQIPKTMAPFVPITTI